jgi:hypothetical protein
MAGLIGGSHRRVKRGEVAHHAFVLILLVSMDSLRVLTKIVETRELLATVTGKWAFTGVLSAWGISEDEKESDDIIVAYRICLAKCSLRLKTIRHSP